MPVPALIARLLATAALIAFAAACVEPSAPAASPPIAADCSRAADRHDFPHSALADRDGASYADAFPDRDGDQYADSHAHAVARADRHAYADCDRH